MLNFFDNQTKNDVIIKSRILVVDDNVKNLQYATKVLIEAGYDVSIAQNGINAINYLQKSNHPDLILLDVMMPEMSGYEVCEKLKDSPATKDIPIIFLTAKNETDDIVKGFELGGVDYISKPFQPKEILVRIKTHIDLIRAKRELVEKNKLLDIYNKSLIDQITERTNALIIAQNNLEDYKEMKANFLAQISHEIRTPVNVIVNFLNLIKMDNEDDESGKYDNELFVAINSASKRLIRTIDMIITMSELQKNIYQVQKSLILLFAEILSPLIDNFIIQAHEKGFRF